MNQKKITLFILTLICHLILGFNQSYATENTLRLTKLKELIRHIKVEVERDRKIISWVDNIIAFQQTRELLERDLPKKNKLLETIINSNYINLDSVIRRISKNIELEIKIKDSLTVYVNEARMPLFRNAKMQIKQALQEKEKLLRDLKNKINRKQSSPIK